MANRLGWLVNAAHFVEDADGVRKPVGTTCLVRRYPEGTSLPSQALIAGGHLPAFDAGDAAQVEVSPDGGATWHGPMQSAEWVADTRARSLGALQHGDLLVSIAAPQYGATLDGVSDSTAAWNAAVAATPEGGTLFIPPGAAVALPNGVSITKPIRVVGYGASIVKTGATLGQWFTCQANNIAFEGVTFSDPGGLVTSTLVSAGGGYSGNTWERCKFTSPAAIGLRLTNQKDVTVTRCVFDDVRDVIHLAGTIERATVTHNRIKGWRGYGIYGYGTVDGAPSDVLIGWNRITDLTTGGTPRYAVHTSLSVSPTMLARFAVIGNTVLGPGLSYTATPAGTADQFGLFKIDGLLVQGNTSWYGGDVGITVENCYNFAVIGNDCRFNDACGIAIYTDVKRGTITGNVAINNGLSRNGDRLDRVKAGIRVGSSLSAGAAAFDLVIGQNVLGDSQAVKTQKYGTSLRQAANVVLGPDVDAGNALALYYNETLNTNLTKVSTVAL